MFKSSNQSFVYYFEAGSGDEFWLAKEVESSVRTLLLQCILYLK
jgi:hypothetical protein